MNTEAAMNGRAINAEEYPIRNRCPGRVLRVAIETNLIFRFRLEFSEDDIFVGEILGRH